MKGYVKRDDDGKIIIDNNGFITVTSEDESLIFQLHLSEIDEKAEQMCFNLNGKDIYIDVYPGWETSEADPIAIENENESKTESYQTGAPSTSKSGNAVFPWCDASTKIFLKEYKLKRELVKKRELKNMKLAYQEISKNLQENGFNVSPLQVENRFKTLKRAYKNMIVSNKRTGRGRYICSYEQDLDEIFSARQLLGDAEMNEDGNADGAGSEYMDHTQNASMKNFKFEHGFGKNNVCESNARLEAQHVKIIENLQNCQRTLKTLMTKIDNRSKSTNEIQHKILQVHMEMREMQREAYARAEEERQKAREDRQKTLDSLEGLIKLLAKKES